MTAWRCWYRNSAARPSAASNAFTRLPTASPPPLPTAIGSSSSSPRWPAKPIAWKTWGSRSSPASRRTGWKRRARWTCCSPPASRHPSPSCPWRSASAAAGRAPGWVRKCPSARTPTTPRRASSTSTPSACTANWTPASRRSSRASKASRRAATSRPSGAAAPTPRLSQWRRPWAPTNVGSTRTWTASTPPIRASWKTRACSTASPSRKCSSWPASAPRCCTPARWSSWASTACRCGCFRASPRTAGAR